MEGLPHVLDGRAAASLAALPAQSLLDLVPGMIAVVSFDGGLAHLNAAARETLECSAEPGSSVFSFLHPGDREQVHALLAALAAGRTAPPLHLRLHWPSGQWKSCEVSAGFLRDADGAPAGAILTAREDRDDSATERRLHESEVAYQGLFDLSPAPMGVHRRGVILSANAAAARLVGAPSARALDGRRLDDFVLTEDRERLVDALASAPLAEEAHFLETRIRRVDGSQVTVEIASAPTSFAGRPATQTIVRDVSERKAAEDERLALERRLAEGQKLESLGLLAGGVAHDFNNLLVAIMGNAGLARLELGPESPAMEHLAAIEAASQRAADLAHQMLAYAGKAGYTVSAINFSDLVRELGRLLAVSISRKVTLDYELAEHLPQVDGDSTQLGQIIMNLVINAAEAIGEGEGVVKLRTGVMQASRAFLAEAHCAPGIGPGRYCFVEVRDSGPGMDAATRSRIFDPFFTTKLTGRGLGLAAAVGIVRAHGGAIRVDSEPGKGAQFRLLFPYHPAATEAGHGDSKDNETWRGSGTVLVVDDEPTVRSLTRRVLERLGFTVLLAADGQEGLERFHEHTGEIVAVLLDLTMPRLGGRECRKLLREAAPTLPILIMSGYEAQETAEELAHDTRGVFLHKPFTLGQLESSVRGLLERA